MLTIMQEAFRCEIVACMPAATSDDLQILRVPVHAGLSAQTGLRGAIQVASNDVQQILAATNQLVREMEKANHPEYGPLLLRASAWWITATADLTAAFPARALRELAIEQADELDAQASGMTDSIRAKLEQHSQDLRSIVQFPVLCAQELSVAQALPRTIRILALVDARDAAHNVYIGAARGLLEGANR